MTRVLFAAYFLEAGLVLLVAPWSAFWDRNFFAAHLPTLEPVLASPFLRGAVSGIGAITVVAGFGELLALFTRPREAAPRNTLREP